MKKNARVGGGITVLLSVRKSRDFPGKAFLLPMEGSEVVYHLARGH